MIAPSYTPNPNDTDLARRSSEGLARWSSEPSLFLTNGEEQVEVPPALFNIIKEVLKHVTAGNAFALIPYDQELSTQEAAQILNVSRPFLVKLLNNNEIDHRKVGSHRRIKFKDLIEYKERTQRKSVEALKELTEQAQELGWDY